MNSTIARAWGAGLLSFLSISGTAAASDPVAWSLSPATGFPTVEVGKSATVHYTLTNRLHRSATIVTSFAKKGSLFTVQDACNNQSLAPQASCNISITYTPQSHGLASIQLTYGYHNNRIPVPVLVVNGTGQNGGCVTSAIASLPLPSTTYQYADNIVQFTFLNSCIQTSTTLGPVTITPTFNPEAGQSATTTIGTDHCSNTVIPPQGSCTVTASVTAQGSGSSTLSVTASALSDGALVTAMTSSALQTGSYQHNVTFINQCPFPVWYGVANDNLTDKTDPTNPAGPDNYLLNAQQPGSPPATKTLLFPGDYLGLFFPRTGCQTIGNQLFCQTGQCIPDSPPNGGRCLLGNEPSPPFTKIEMNFFNAAQGDGSFDGDYDISLIEGFNVPVEMKGFGPGTTIVPFDPSSPGTVNNTAFQCGSAGAPIQAANPPTPALPLASCPWTVTPPSTNTMEPQFFNFVTDGDTAAGQNNCSCTTQNPVCGIAFKATSPQQGNLIMSCGQLLGTWALKTLCTQPFATTVTNTANNNSRIRFNCDTDISLVAGTQPSYSPGTTLSDIYGCVYNSGVSTTVLNSCYIDATFSTSYCCGATDWNTTSPYTTAQDKQSITQNPDWGGPTVMGSSTIVPSPYETIVWYKNACPTSYSYPFDDHSTSFYCKKSNSGVNVKMDYQVVFCPGGLTGQATS